MSEHPTDNLEALLTSIYEAPLEEPAWRNCLPVLRQAFHADGFVLTLRHPSLADQDAMLLDGFPPQQIDLGNNVYGAMYAADPFVNLPLNKAVTLAEQLDIKALVSTEFYHLCMEPFGIYHILGADLSSGSEVDASLRFTRQSGHKAFDRRDSERLDRLIPHLQRALRIHSRIEHMQTERALYAETVSRFAVASLLLDEQQQLVSSNPLAEQLLAQNDGIALKGRQLLLAHSSDNKMLKNLIARALEARQRGDMVFAEAMPVHRPSGKPHYGLVVRPMLRGRLGDDQQDPVVALFVSDPAAEMAPAETALSQLYGLTPAESRLALQLANGLSLEEASSALNISRNTARAHLRAIFSKTDVSQQSQLVRLILKSVASLG